MGVTAAALAGCVPESPTTRPSASASSVVTSPAGPAPVPSPTGRLIGDGSTQDTGPQPHQPRPQRLGPGEEPPQFVVLSWDGAGSAQLFTRFRGLAQELGGAMTFFLSGIYTLPERNRSFYRPPRHPVGASSLGFLSDRSVHDAIEQVGIAWHEGHEIGTHFNGHFCGPGGVSDWSPADWDSEIDQAIAMVSQWRTNTGFTDLPPLPFDYAKELIGGRTPCLEGRANLLKAKRVQQWRYDSSGTGIQTWPSRFRNGLWNLPMQQIPFPGHSFEVLAMDYNMMFNQSRTPNGDASRRPTWYKQARDAYLAGFQRAYTANRAPLIIGNHFERWNGGIYMDAITDAVRQMAQHDSVRFVSFRQLVEWLDAQDPAVLAKLRTLPVGHKPTGGWATFLGST
ncbi:hypothetical protein F4553_001430 [Allocatelliglobosispora scoriae]|uniref:Secreted protein n=1 Tax=Allocatelliglobosispora scoriae TaxID=643052 RepID=A0A841BMH5_9ACTN|nr:hypothetical protein [Allocatelliglobosispora scoriae]MBB5868051.1 hypothetical protein [Allocatelliglobosispora scoriae]